MLKTMINVDEDISLILHRLADAEKRSQTDIMREALQRYLQQTQALNPNLPSGIGRFHSGRSDISQRAKELHQQAIHREYSDSDR